MFTVYILFVASVSIVVIVCALGGIFGSKASNEFASLFSMKT